MDLYQSQIDNSSAKLAFYSSLDTINIFDLRYKRSPKILKEILFRRQSGFAFRRNNFMYPLTEIVLQRIIPTGVMKFISEYGYWLSVRTDPAEDDGGPSILVFDDLSFGFVLWLGACGISTCAFLLEVISKVTRKKQEVKVRKVKFAKVHPIGIDIVNDEIQVNDETAAKVQIAVKEINKDVNAIEVISVRSLSIKSVNI